MRYIGEQEIEDIATGAAILGAGGGGDPYIGKLMALGAVRKHGKVKLIDPDSIADDALIIPVAMMGAPTVLEEKACNGGEYIALCKMVEDYFGRKIDALMPMEAGGFNSLLPVSAAASMGLPLVDVDGMGRAFPELQMVTFTIGGISASPMALADEKGNSVIFNTISNKWTEELARAVTMSCGGSVSVTLYPMNGKQVKEFGVKGIVTKSENLGKTIRTLKTHGTKETLKVFLEKTEGYALFEGKITDVRRETNGAFNLGTIELEGIENYTGKKAQVEFQNENLLCRVDGKIVATVPDLVCIVDCENFNAVTTETLKYGKRIYVIGLPCYHLWRTKKGIELAGPSYFGIDTDYKPIEERIKELSNEI